MVVRGGLDGDRRLSDQVASYLRDRIYRGELQPNQRLGEEEICRELKISRAPLREALLTLEKEGLVNVRPHRGTVVRMLSDKDLAEIAGLRTLIEPYAVRMLMNGGVGDDTESIKNALDEMQTAVRSTDSVAVAMAHVRFHVALGLGSGSPRLAAFLEQLLRQSLAFHGYAMQTTDALASLVDNHVSILRAVTGEDIDFAEEAVRRHINGDT